MNPHDLPALVRSAELAPPIRRGSMVPRPWAGFWQSLLPAGQPVPAPQREARVSSPLLWERAASRRRTTLVSIIALVTGSAAFLLWRSQSFAAHPLLHVLQLALFVILLGWVTAGFVTALMGAWVQWRGDRHALSLETAARRKLDGSARTALIMPICNEPVATVFAGLRATCESLAASPAASLFDVFILSDSSDPALRVQEMAAWASLRDQLGDRCRLYYRVRQRRTRRKAGNVADFCRRWGHQYRYMVVLDADSVMSGEALTRLVQLMETHPKAGIIQTAPQACGAETLHARAQQFAGRVTGSLFTAGMQYWQLGESHYWGHNAIIRIEPFMKHCALALLPGTGGLSGEILSHDFVEAALMRRAGYTVWLVPGLGGSYEQLPPNLMEELQRDRRWCQGNLKNVRLIAEPGLRPVHRAMLATGVMAYASAPLWLGFLLVSLTLHLLEPHPAGPGEGTASLLTALWALTAVLLFVPRMLAVAAFLPGGRADAFGGKSALLKGALLETLLSLLQAPIRMVAHTLFVVTALTGLGLDWKSPPRDAQSVSWDQAVWRFLPVSAIVTLILAFTYRLHPDAVWWLLPVGIPLLLAIPLVVLTSYARWGRLLRLQRWLLVPEERSVPTVLRQASAFSLRPRAKAPSRPRAGSLPLWSTLSRSA